MQLDTDCKCACASCGQEIAYRAMQAGDLVTCPRCGEQSRLPNPEKLGMIELLGPQAPEFRNCDVCGWRVKFWDPVCPACEQKRRKKILIRRVCVAVIVLSAASAGFLTWHFSKPKPQPVANIPHIFLAQPQARLPKSTNDLRPLHFTLERQRGQTTAVAVGDIFNDSLNVHHHVRADVDILDRSGKKIGNASDYFQDLGANQTWHFVAPVSDPNAMSVRFAGFKEDE